MDVYTNSVRGFCASDENRYRQSFINDHIKLMRSAATVGRDEIVMAVLLGTGSPSGRPDGQHVSMIRLSAVMS